jgi:hypothetical protein
MATGLDAIGHWAVSHPSDDIVISVRASSTALAKSAFGFAGKLPLLARGETETFSRLVLTPLIEFVVATRNIGTGKFSMPATLPAVLAAK